MPQTPDDMLPDFPSAEELAELEGDSVPAAGFALIPEQTAPKRSAIFALAGVVIAAAGAVVYRLFRRTEVR